jgi:transcriptional regulator with XRE-family HTH domain
VAVIIELPSIDPVQAALGAQLKRLRRARGLTLHELAEEIEISPARLGLGEQGRIRLTSAELHGVTAALHIPMRLLWEPTADLTRLRRL